MNFSWIITGSVRECKHQESELSLNITGWDPSLRLFLTFPLDLTEKEYQIMWGNSSIKKNNLVGTREPNGFYSRYSLPLGVCLVFSSFIPVFYLLCSQFLLWCEASVSHVLANYWSLNCCCYTSHWQPRLKQTSLLWAIKYASSVVLLLWSVPFFWLSWYLRLFL